MTLRDVLLYPTAWYLVCSLANATVISAAFRGRCSIWFNQEGVPKGTSYLIYSQSSTTAKSCLVLSADSGAVGVRITQGSAFLEQTLVVSQRQCRVLPLLLLKRYNKCKPCTTYNVQGRLTIPMSASVRVRGAVHEEYELLTLVL